ncbi:hypothetical protein T439DRAFT_358473 [Meredithblackwellia eburnea MCA 4105]
MLKLSQKRKKPSFNISPDPNDLSVLSFTAFEELETIRNTIDGLRSKVSLLEAVLVQAFGKAKDQKIIVGQELEEEAPLEEPDEGLKEKRRRSKGKQKAEEERDKSLGESTSSLAAAPTPAQFSSSSQYQNASDNPESSTSLISNTFIQPFDHPPLRGDDLRGEEVEASIALEFLALGRNRTIGRVPPLTQVHPERSTSETQLPSSSMQVLYPPLINPSFFEPTPQPPCPAYAFPTAASLSALLPPYAQSQAIINHSLSNVSWYHSAVHTPTFLEEIRTFWESGEERCDKVNQSWLALFFAQLCGGIKHMTKKELHDLVRLTEEEAALLSKTHFNAALCCLYRSNFVECHSLWALQTIVVLALTGQDEGLSNLFPTLISTGVAIAQDMGFHRLSDESFLHATEGLSPRAKAQALVEHEVKKRVFWGLTAQDWFSIPFAKKSCVHPSQVTTPYPANATDEDLLTGVMTNRDRSHYTVVGNLLNWLPFARALHDTFEHLDANTNPSYQFLLDEDQKMQDIIANPPAWMRSDGPTDGMPPCFNWVRTTFRISSAHKVLTLHRPFFNLSFKDARYQSSRVQVLAASRTILQEAALLTEMPAGFWTIPYHISAAASVVCLDLFQSGSQPRVLEEERAEVKRALAALRTSSSAIAVRGVALIESLLSEEAKLHTPSTIPQKRDFVDEGEQAPAGGVASNTDARIRMPKRVALASPDLLSPASTFAAQRDANNLAMDVTSSTPEFLVDQPSPGRFPLPPASSSILGVSQSAPSWTTPGALAQFFDFDSVEGTFPPEFMTAFIDAELDSSTPKADSS